MGIKLAYVDGQPSPWTMETRHTDDGETEYLLESEGGPATEVLHVRQARIAMEGGMLISGIEEDERRLAALALSEVCANAVEHGGGLLSAHVITRGNEVQSISAANPLRDAETVPAGVFDASDSKEDLDALDGRGLIMVDALCGPVEHIKDTENGSLITRVHLGRTGVTGALLN